MMFVFHCINMVYYIYSIVCILSHTFILGYKTTLTQRSQCNVETLI